MAQSLDRAAYDIAMARALTRGSGDELIAWRARADSYPRVPFADVFAVAEGRQAAETVPDFAGKVVVIGATAPSLHDIHPTPLSVSQAGVDTLATAIDNVLNRRHIAEIEPRQQAALAVALCIGLALWGGTASLSSLAPALFVLPLTLLGISYLTLNGMPAFLDLHLPAGLALLFLAMLRFWNSLRRNHWCAPAQATTESLAIACWAQENAWSDAAVDRLMNAIERHAPACRLIVGDANVSWPSALRWPEMHRFASVLGPRTDLEAALPALAASLRLPGLRCGALVPIVGAPDRRNLAHHALMAQWSLSSSSDTIQKAVP